MKVRLLSLPLTGHLNPRIALARKLQERGEEPVFFGIPDTESAVRAAGIPFIPICEEEYPSGSVARLWGPIASMRGLPIMQYWAEHIHPDFLQAHFRHLPGKLREAGIDGLVLDTALILLELVPLSLELPFVQICNVLHLDPTGTTPASVVDRPYDLSPETLAQNAEDLQSFGSLSVPFLPIAQAFAASTNLTIDFHDPGATASKLAILTQTPREFDYPGIPWPPHFHYTGPFSDASGRAPISFPWEKLDGKPLVYASLGTLVNRHPAIHRAILGAVALLPDIQLVFSIGGNVSADELGPVPSNAILVRTAPQAELLQRAALCITHAGLNTTLEALAEAVPLVTIPIGYDQPGVAARIAYHGLGEFLKLESVSVETLLPLLRQVLAEPRYREQARHFQQIIRRTDGLTLAADAIGKVFA